MEEEKLIIEKIDKLEKKIKSNKLDALVSSFISGFVAMCGIIGTTVYNSCSTELDKFFTIFTTGTFGAFSVYEIKRMIESLIRKHTYENKLEECNEELYALRNKNKK